MRALQLGYRHLPLRTPSGEQFSFSTLFCKISKAEEIDVLCNEPLQLERTPSLFRRASQRIGFGKRPGSTERWERTSNHHCHSSLLMKYLFHLLISIWSKQQSIQLRPNDSHYASITIIILRMRSATNQALSDLLRTSYKIRFFLHISFVLIAFAFATCISNIKIDYFWYLRRRRHMFVHDWVVVCIRPAGQHRMLNYLVTLPSTGWWY